MAPPAARAPLEVGRLLVIAAVPALLLAAFLAAGVRARFAGNPSALFYFGEPFSAGAALPAGAIVRADVGYDGQFYYRIARAPLAVLERLASGERTAVMPGIDTPSYRYRRVVQPWTARLLAFGSVAALPWTFPLASLAALALGVACAVRLCEGLGRSGLFGLFYAAIPGLVFAASRNLCEGVATALACAAMLAIARRRRLAAAALLVAAHLAHETTLVLSLGCVVSSALERRWRDAAAAAVPIAVALAWYALVASAFGVALCALFTEGRGGAALALPGAGLAHRLAWLWDPRHASGAYAALPTAHRFWRQEALVTLATLLAVAALVRAGWRRRSEAWAAALAAAALVLSFGDTVWIDPASFARVSSVAVLIALRVAVEDPDPIGYAFLASLPPAAIAALGWCWDNWKFWPLASA